jgi:hypothetical protein
MVSWVATKLFLKKSWIWIKHNWWLPVGAALLLVGFLTGRRNTAGIMKVMSSRKEQADTEIKALQDAHEQQVDIQREYAEGLKRFAEEHGIKEKEITKENRDALMTAAEASREDPDAMAKELAKLYGLTHVEGE